MYGDDGTSTLISANKLVGDVRTKGNIRPPGVEGFARQDRRVS
jgi:hypothetical protein